MGVRGHTPGSHPATPPLRTWCSRLLHEKRWEPGTRCAAVIACLLVAVCRERGEAPVRPERHGAEGGKVQRNAACRRYRPVFSFVPPALLPPLPEFRAFFRSLC